VNASPRPIARPTLPNSAGNTILANVDAAPFKPIGLEEIIDENNLIPEQMHPIVMRCRIGVQEELKRQGIDIPALPYKEALNKVDVLVRSWVAKENLNLDTAELRWVRSRISDDILGSGPVEPFRRDTRVTEVLVFQPRCHRAVLPDGTYRLVGGTSVEFQGEIDGKSGLVPAPGVIFDSPQHILDTTARPTMAATAPSSHSPRMSATLPDGSRLQVTHGCVTTGTTSFALRRHPEVAHTMLNLEEWGSVSKELAEDLAWFVLSRFNLILAGGTGSGKTTLLNAMLPFANPKHHVFIVEDTKEIKTPPYLQVSRRIARVSRAQEEAVSIRDHIKDALRFRPDIILVGEVRDAAALEALKAMNTGHEGSMTTCHSNSAADTVLRLAQMMSESVDIADRDLATDMISRAVDIIIFQRRFPDGARRVAKVVEVVKPDLNSTLLNTHVVLKTLWEWDDIAKKHVKPSGPSPELFDYRNLPRAEKSPFTWEDIVRYSNAQAAEFAEDSN